MRRAYYWVIYQLLSRSSGQWFCLWFNIIALVGRKKRRCFFDDGMYRLSEPSRSIFFTRPQRYRYYVDGIAVRIEDLYQQYVGGIVSISERDVVIDCGANIGEFSLYCEERGALCVAFEPDPTECAALRKNLSADSLVYSYALWRDDESVRFKLQNDTGDSSVSEENWPGNIISVEGRKLDGIKEVASQSRIRLLKLEAEGFELEVLQGSERLLEKIEFICADLGPERGPLQSSSLPEVINFLVTRGFMAVFFNPSRSIVLFKNKRILGDE